MPNWDEIKGEVKEGAGKVVGDDKLEVEGKLDQAKGKVEELGDKIGDAFDDAKDKITGAVDRD